MDIPTSNHHIGSTERVFVAHVNDLNDFYLHSESLHNVLIKLAQDLYAEYSQSLTKSTDSNRSFRVDEFCACPSESEDWYRGLIRQLHSDGTATVFKIDYGDVQDIPMKFLQPLKEQYFKIPRLAFHCSLANLVKPYDGWPIDVVKDFRSRLATTFLYAQLINYNEIRDIVDVEITEQKSKTPLNKDYERYQLESSSLKINDEFIYKHIQMDSLDSIQSNQIRLLYYLNPNHFYVYFPDKIKSHLSFQSDLQNAIQDLHSLTPTNKHLPIAVKDNQALWHRAIALDSIISSQSKLSVYFLDIGQCDYVSIENIRSLPEEFYCKPAFAISCSLSNVSPLNSNDHTWKSSDPVHSEFNRLMVNTLNCQVRAKQDQLLYEIEIEIPKIGDLATFLADKRLVSRSTMRGSQQSRFSSSRPTAPPQNAFVRQQLQSTGLASFRAQQTQQRFPQPNDYQTANAPPRMVKPSVQMSSSIPILPPQEGMYKIVQVRNAGEFYGLSQIREKEYTALSQRLEDYYNNLSNESLLRDNLVIEGMPYVIQDREKYQRVIVKHRDSETRVTVKFVDRGDETFVDITELLQIDQALSTIPAFAQPFRLRGYEDSQNSPNMTQNLKKLISNQTVRITPTGQTHNGFYDVDVLLNNQPVNRIILNNEKLPIQPASSSSSRFPNTHIESQVFNNSSRYQSNSNQDFHGSRPNADLAAPQKVLTAQFVRPPMNRFPTGGNQTTSSNEQPSRFQGFSNRNNDANQQPFGRQTSGSSQRNDENRPMNHQQSSFDQKRSFNNHEDRNEGGFRRGSSFSSRGRGGGLEQSSHFGNRNDDEKRNENSSYSSSSGGFQRRGGGGFQDFNNSNRGGFRGGFTGRREQGDNNDSDRRGGRGGGGPRGGSRSFRGGFNSNFRDRDTSDIELTSNAPAGPAFSNWPNARPSAPFEPGEAFRESTSPKDSFKFVVSYIETANDFFIQLLSKGDELSSLNETLQTEYKKSPETNLSSFKQGQACLAKSSTYGCWYRAIVLSTGVSQVKIRFIDFGDTQDVDAKNIRQIEKKHCSTPPYAYPCTFANAEVVNETDKEQTISQCEEKDFNGKIITKTSEGKYILECEALFQALVNINAIKETKSAETTAKPAETTMKRTKCSIAYVDSTEHEFYIQEDSDTVDLITGLIEQEDQDNPVLSIDEVNQLEPNTIIIAKYDDAPYRAIIKSKKSDEELDVYFIDYGNTSSYSISSTKRASENLSKYAHQAKHCRLYGIPSNELDKAYEDLNEYLENESVEISIINKEDEISNVLVYIENQCFNEKFGYNPNHQPINEENILSTNVEQNPPLTNIEENDSLTDVEEQNVPTEEDVPVIETAQVESSSSKTRTARLVYVEKDRPYVYLQFSPECDDILGEINDIIEKIVEENKRDSTYEVGQKIIAKFHADDQFYRARIESYSPSSETYNIYFLDFGNTDENTTNEYFYSYSEQLESFEAQAHGYSLGQIPTDQWTEEKRAFVDENSNNDIQFEFLDENQSIIYIDFPNKEQIYSSETTTTTNDNKQIFDAKICSTDNNCFYIHILPDDDLHLGEIEDFLQTCDKQKQDSWSIDDRCLVVNDDEKYFRGQIRSINDNQYDIQCIDYGTILTNRTIDQLFQLPSDDLCRQQALAHQCRLFGYDDEQQTDPINQRIRDIPNVETVKILVENRTDSCLYVTVTRDNSENINQQESDKEMNDETSHISQSLSTLSVTNNQTIDFGENDPSTTTLIDQTNNSMLTD